MPVTVVPVWHWLGPAGVNFKLKLKFNFKFVLNPLAGLTFSLMLQIVLEVSLQILTVWQAHWKHYKYHLRPGLRYNENFKLVRVHIAPLLLIDN